MITLPIEPSPLDIRMYPRTTLSTSRGPQTGHSSSYRYPGKWWEIEIELPEMNRDSAEAWIAAMILLTSGETFQWGPRAVTDVDFAPPRGSVTSVVISSASPANSNLLYISDGDFSPGGTAGAGIENWAVGDYIGVGGTLQKILAQPTWNAAQSRYELKVFPGLRNALVIDTAAELANPVATFRMPTPDMEFVHHHYYGQDPLVIAAIEAIQE